MIRKIRAIWDLTRLEHGLMYGFGVLIGIIIAGGRIYEPASICGLSVVLPSFGATFGFFTALFIQAGTFALNDYCDLESDIANQRLDRPLVRGELSKKEALLVSISATTLGIIIASFLHPVLFILAFISGVLGILYDLKMKEFLAVSNIYIALTMAIPFIFGGLIVEPDRIDLVLLVLAAIAFLAGFGREVMKDIADIKGDALRDIKSIARLYGVKQASRVVIFLYALAVVLSAIPLFSINTAYYFDLAYLFPVMAADALFLHTCFQLLKTRDETGDYNRMRKETLLAIGIGLIAFVSGALWQVNFL
jgi:geranylgeranylglycerol-phosphate geranylgeranyltransferase